MGGFLNKYREVLARGEDLPALPTVVVELQGALENETSSADRISSIIMQDPALASRLLRLANSAAFNPGREIAAVGSAVQVLGVRQVRALCIALAVTEALGGDSDVVDESFWKHSAGVAMVSKALAACLDYDAIPHDELYVGALLHDVGVLVMDRYYPGELVDCSELADEAGIPLHTAETIILGTDHGELGGLLLDNWGLPASTVAMVANHHHPLLGPERYKDLCWLVSAAEQICGGMGPSFAIEKISMDRSQRVLCEIRDAGFDTEAIVDALRSNVATV